MLVKKKDEATKTAEHWFVMALNSYKAKRYGETLFAVSEACQVKEITQPKQVNNQNIFKRESKQAISILANNSHTIASETTQG